MPEPKADSSGTDVRIHPYQSDLPVTGKPMKEAVWDLKVQMLERPWPSHKFNQKKAAKLLGLTYHQFRGLYRQYNVRTNNE